MTRFVRDTDIVSLLQRGNETVAGHVSHHRADEVATTIITVEEQLRKQHPRTGRMDLQIAAIAVAHQATLVTRNLSDFDTIVGLAVVD